ncbi:hypothetical protein AX15_000869 [Amanita polypyramis BW_CC]|nr:hypothetical protein AX15_000869 [Amanita polypyramis BW_CC]
MYSSLKSVLLLAAWASSCCTVLAIQRVSRSGRYLYTQDQNRFYIKGVAYQEQGAVVASADNNFGEPSTFIDSLALGDGCKRDLPYLQQLGINTIRVYSVNSSLNHDSCMATFSNAGIYTIIDLSLPLNGSIDRTVPTWSTNMLNEYITTIDAFSKYDNVLAYNVGNEVVLQDSTQAAPYVKAAARDVKAYLKSKNYNILVGYAAVDGSADWRNVLANYLSCDPSNSNTDSTAIDLYGLNNYEWCGDSSYQASYANTNDAYAQYNVVAYFSEFGCITSPPRLWTEAGALFSSQMSSTWSGGIAFSYFPAQSVQGQFGMVNVSADGSTVTPSDDFNRLKTQYGLVNSPNSPSMSNSAASSYSTCPSQNSAFVASDTLPPTPNEAACDCLENNLGCRFTPATSNYSVIVGQLTDVACSLLGQKGASCADIGSNGTTGVYGRVSDCDPSIKLSYIMSLYYQLNNRDPGACSFAGNGTVNSSAPPSISAANAAASSCISNPGSTFVPTGPASTRTSGTSASSGSGHNSARAVLADINALYGMTTVVMVTMASVFWTLLF